MVNYGQTNGVRVDARSVVIDAKAVIGREIKSGVAATLLRPLAHPVLRSRHVWCASCARVIEERMTHVTRERG